MSGEEEEEEKIFKGSKWKDLFHMREFRAAWALWRRRQKVKAASESFNYAKTSSSFWTWGRKGKKSKSKCAADVCFLFLCLSRHLFGSSLVFQADAEGNTLVPQGRRQVWLVPLLATRFLFFFFFVLFTFWLLAERSAGGKCLSPFDSE